MYRTLLLRTDIRDRAFRYKAFFCSSYDWLSFYRVLLAFFSQSIAGMIEMYVLGIKPGSENTARLMDIARTTPLVPYRHLYNRAYFGRNRI